jgi:hypothetical protein
LARKFADLKRRKPYRSEAQRFILICEGEKTEPAYFNALKSKYPGAMIQFEFIAPAGTPITIKDKARDRMAALKKEMRDNPSAKADNVWAVFDRDEHGHISDAIQGCETMGVEVAFSNPCFEVWLLLHYEDYHAADDRHQVQKRLREKDTAYDPNGSKTPNCIAIVDKVETAEQRAINQCNQRELEGLPLGRPSTTVYQLTQAIRNAAEAAKPKRP